MLRRADNVSISHKAGMFSGKGYVMLKVGRSEYRLVKHTKNEFSNFLTHQGSYPVALTTLKGRKCWIFQDRFYWENESLDADQVYALLVAQQRRRQQQIENAQATVAMRNTPRTTPVRRPIPDDTKLLVWERDGGQCRSCGATSELQYDHIIPVALGGGNSPENIQILCGPCNRSKSAGLTNRR